MPTLGWVGPGLPREDGKYLFTSDLKKDDKLVIDSMIQILLTRQRERVGNPTFGSLLDLLPFEQQPLSIPLAEQYAKEALARWEPRANVTDLIVEIPHNEPNTLLLTVSFTLIKTGQPGQFTTRITL